MAIKHDHTAVANEIVASSYWNADHTGTADPTAHAITSSSHTSTATSGQMLKANASGLPVDATNTDTQISSAVTASHARSHVITGTSDHTSTATSGQMLKANVNGLPIDATNTDTDVADAVTKKHTANADTDLDATFEATFVKTTDNVAVLADITSAGANIEDAVTKRHSANADTILGSDCVALDHVTAATDTVGNYCYGTGDPPAANTTTEGALFVKYTA